MKDFGYSVRLAVHISPEAAQNFIWNNKVFNVLRPPQRGGAPIRHKNRVIPKRQRSTEQKASPVGLSSMPSVWLSCRQRKKLSGI